MLFDNALAHERLRTNLRFRDDINGLRAIAVVAVVVYHFRLGLAGGFAGVDVFFVISGFLMSEIIRGRIERGTFSLLEFYEARIRRIVPALVVCIVCVLAAGVLLLDPWKFEGLARDAVYSLLFASNYLYLTQGGYFALSPDQNWLLHTWSLAVEGQFYVLFALIMLCLEKVRAKPSLVTAVLAAVAIVSLWRTLGSGYRGDKSLEFRFYMLYYRAWEFLIGALVAHTYHNLRLRLPMQIFLHGLGLVLVFLSIGLWADSETPWPSLLTLVLAAGVALILLADLRRPFWAIWKPTRAIGLWSYSIYLWHWPIEAASASFGYVSLPSRLCGLVASIALGFISHSVVENRLTDRIWRRPQSVLRVGLASYATILTLAIIGVATQGTETIRFAFRPDIREALSHEREARKDWSFPDACAEFTWKPNVGTLCKFGNLASDDVLVIGDSFAEQIAPRYKALLEGSKFGVTFATRGACLPVPHVAWRLSASKCDQWVDQVYAYASHHQFKKVILIAYWSLYDQSNLCLVDEMRCGAGLAPRDFSNVLDRDFAAAADRWRALRQQGKQVFVFDVMPDGNGEGDPVALYARSLRGYIERNVSTSLVKFEQEKGPIVGMLSKAASGAGVGVIDPAPSFCSEGKCPIVRDGKPIYRDKSHLRASVVEDPSFTFYDSAIMPGGSTEQYSR